MIPRLHRHVMLQVLKGTASTFGAVALLVAVAIMFQYYRDGILSGLLMVLFYSLPKIVAFGLPVSFFAGTVLAVGGMAASDELRIMRASGVSLAQIYLPLLGLAMVLSFVLVLCWDRAVPGGNRRIEKLLRSSAFEVLERLDDNEERLVSLSDLSIRFSKRTQEGRPVRIVSSQKGTKRFVSANDVSVSIAQDGSYATVKLRDGFVTEESDRNLPRTDFDSLTFEIPGPGYERKREFRDRHTLTLLQVAEEVKKIDAIDASREEPHGLGRLARRFRSFLHYQLASALAPLFLAFAAIPLGLLISGVNRVTGIAAALAFVFVVFYPLLIGGRFIADEGYLPAWLALEAPNIASLVLGLVLLRLVYRNT
ncbi:MAG: LptF/LptG family permease [Planctomycetota bacterium]|nr:LptF/LptG family permease [Planctomycetota bacterium]